MKPVISATVDPSVQKAIIAVSATSGVWGALKEMVGEIFGVPIQVVMAAAAAAFGARSFMPSSGYPSAISAGLVWTAIGSFAARGVLTFIAGHNVDGLASGYLAAVAMAISGGGQWVAPVLAEQLPALVRGWIAKLGERKSG